ncbi:MAG: hypothetical protein P8M16_06265 [Acidimicrobiales bacterium]|nr:hypothetical protein [Acidimicrobiales bacterium]
MATTQRTQYGHLRDTQRSKIYRAEHVLGPHTLGNRYKTVTDCHEFMMSVIERKTFQDWFPRAASTLSVGLEVRPGRGARHAFASSPFAVTLPRWARNEPVMIHELCHLVVHHEFPHKEIALHGWQFSQTYLKIVGDVLGPNAHRKLKASFEENRVKFTSPRKKLPVAENQRQVLRERSVATRSATH